MPVYNSSIPKLYNVRYKLLTEHGYHNIVSGNTNLIGGGTLAANNYRVGYHGVEYYNDFRITSRMIWHVNTAYITTDIVGRFGLYSYDRINNTSNLIWSYDIPSTSFTSAGTKTITITGTSLDGYVFKKNQTYVWAFLMGSPTVALDTVGRVEICSTSITLSPPSTIPSSERSPYHQKYTTQVANSNLPSTLPDDSTLSISAHRIALGAFIKDL
ncbi:MAG: hypothetical protein QXO37_02475 [Candidatus Nitrosocaldaceae archaeon]